MAWVKQSGGAEFSDRSGYKFLSYQTLAKLAQNPGQLPFIRAAAGHPDVVRGVMTEEQAEAALANVRTANLSGHTGGSGVIARPQFARGKVVKHIPSGRKVTILAAAGRKGGETLHEVVDAKTGKKFVARESNLKGLA